MSSFHDPRTGIVHPLTSTEELLEVIPELQKMDIGVDVFPNIIQKSFFLTTPDWKPLYHFIQQKAKKYDGFIVIQESDTLIYASCLLGFLTAAFYKPIIFTAYPTPIGSQYRNNAQNNLLGAIVCAAADIGETAIFSDEKLIRGVRAKRQNIETPQHYFSSFTDDIAEFHGETLHLNLHRIRRDDLKCEFPYQYPQKTVFFLRYFPDFPEDFFYMLFENHLDALVIESLGFGDLPAYILERLEQFKEVNTKVVIVAEHDSPLRTFPIPADEVEKSFPNIVPIKNMTVGTTLVKTIFVLENFPDAFETKMNENFCGDIVR